MVKFNHATETKSFNLLLVVSGLFEGKSDIL